MSLHPAGRTPGPPDLRAGGNLSGTWTVNKAIRNCSVDIGGGGGGVLLRRIASSNGVRSDEIERREARATGHSPERGAPRDHRPRHAVKKRY